MYIFCITALLVHTTSADNVSTSPNLPLGAPSCRYGRHEYCISKYGQCSNYSLAIGPAPSALNSTVPENVLCNPSIACSQDCTDLDSLPPPWPSDGSSENASCSAVSEVSGFSHGCRSSYGYCSKLLYSGCQQRIGCDKNCKNILTRHGTELTALLPWNWTMSSTQAAPGSCPSASTILGTFAGVNFLSTFLSLLLGHRRIAHKLSFGVLGGEPSLLSITLGWIFAVGLHLSANVIIAALIKGIRGYGNEFSVVQLMLFFTVRPRLSWIFLAVFSRLSSDDLAWLSTAASQALAEITLQLISGYYMTKTVKFANDHGYYIIGSLPGAIGKDARLMYSAAIFWLAAGPVAILLALVYPVRLYGLYFLRGSDGSLYTPTSSHVVPYLLPMYVVNWTACWMFWAGFVELAGDLYCPPRLLTQGAIWVVFSALASFFGTGF